MADFQRREISAQSQLRHCGRERSAHQRVGLQRHAGDVCDARSDCLQKAAECEDVFDDKSVNAVQEGDSLRMNLSVDSKKTCIWWLSEHILLGPVDVRIAHNARRLGSDSLS